MIAGVESVRHEPKCTRERPSALFNVLEDCSKISISKLGKVIDSLEEKEGYVSKADVIAALRIKGNVDNSAESRGSQNLALSGARRSRPSSALEKVERYQFQTRPVSAGVSRQRRSVSATRLSKTEPTVASVDKEALQATRIQHTDAEPEVAKQGSSIAKNSSKAEVCSSS
eukprot:CAMPEP_0169322272 /NCGR_PEP_ID=MMETSP1017-20121227/9334_1 /TAXON_ID=342587 /ORGANISM="Karlodinium micrum, Strain CCMP2283" /LENGTH=170 /DNA_ID=CAMNT_0009416809 /DNA_START=50 /DNA_END=557 /DNA_ORIENTATION=-